MVISTTSTKFGSTDFHSHKYSTLSFLHFLFGSLFRKELPADQVSQCLHSAFPRPDHHCNTMTPTPASFWPPKLHHLMDNKKQLEINESRLLVNFLPKYKTLALYCFLPLHLTVHAHPVASSSSGGSIIRFTGRLQTVLSISK